MSSNVNGCRDHREGGNNDMEVNGILKFKLSQQGILFAYKKSAYGSICAPRIINRYPLPGRAYSPKKNIDDCTNFFTNVSFKKKTQQKYYTCEVPCQLMSKLMRLLSLSSIILHCFYSLYIVITYWRLHHLCHEFHLIVVWRLFKVGSTNKAKFKSMAYPPPCTKGEDLEIARDVFPRIPSQRTGKSQKKAL